MAKLKSTNIDSSKVVRGRNIVLLIFIGILAIALIVLAILFSSARSDYSKVKDTIDKVHSAIAAGGEAGDLDYAYFDNSGNIIFSNLEGYETGGKVKVNDIMALQKKESTGRGDIYYVSAQLNSEGEQIGLVLVMLPNRSIVSNFIGTIIISTIMILAVAATLIYQLATLKKRKEDPIINLRRNVIELANGNIETPFSAKNKGDFKDVFEDLESLRQEMVKMQDVDKISKEKEKTLRANITHDLKTPLSIIAGCAESLQDGLYDKDYARIISDQITHMNKLIGEIVESTTAEIGQIAEGKEKVDARMFFTEQIEALKTIVQKSGRKMRAGRIPDVQLYIEEKRIARVMHNLVSNALKFTEEGLGKIKIKFIKFGGKLYVSVIDNGVGVSKEDLPFVFDKFYRGDAARNVKTGSGLGLSITKDIIESHGGTITCRSEPGKKTVFKFSLPFYKESMFEDDTDTDADELLN